MGSQGRRGRSAPLASVVWLGPLIGTGTSASGPGPSEGGQYLWPDSPTLHVLLLPRDLTSCPPPESVQFTEEGPPVQRAQQRGRSRPLQLLLFRDCLVPYLTFLTFSNRNKK